MNIDRQYYSVLTIILWESTINEGVQPRLKLCPARHDPMNNVTVLENGNIIDLHLDVNLMLCETF